jgi:SAM-dependent methyltransferase
MTTLDARSDRAATPAPPLFALTIFASAALVFMVEPMVAKMMLPLLGGGPSIWNTSLAFFQAMLLAGYGYAHLLQKLRSLKAQALIHVALLVLAGLVLPLRVWEMFGPPDSAHPALWLLGALVASIGAPFAVLSATAPLVQSWHARTVHAETGAEPYVLYAASNLGSLLALVAYPALVEPLSPLHGQTLTWSLAYGVFVLLIAGLGLFVVRRDGARTEPLPQVAAGLGPTLLDRLVWVLLAAAPSSLMLGVTTYITTDVASAPFLWVIPLALYLLTFILAFAARPAISNQTALVLQAAALAACAAILPFPGTNLAVNLVVHLGAFFLTALICHQALVARRPDPAHLTEFYLWMSFGGVVGGGFNAFLAPVIFNNVWEYPLILTLACLARPWGRGGFEPWRWVTLIGGILAAVAAPALTPHINDHHFAHLNILVAEGPEAVRLLIKLAMAAAIVCAFIVRRRALAFFALIAIISLAAEGAGDRIDVRTSWRNFFGVVKESHILVPGLGGDVKMLAHGTTLHGAQAQHPTYRCRPLLYYAPETPIGQVFKSVRAQRPAIRVGAVGLGTGAVAAYTRPADRLTFFEIDPQVIALATDPAHFSYTTECARGAISYVLGDARLTLARQPRDTFDILLIDAFSSDSVPAHLLTVEAVRGYLTHLKPDGVLILHLSNRNLDLPGPAMAVAHAAGGFALVQKHRMAEGQPALWESSEDAVIVARSPQALAAFAADPRWRPADPGSIRPWTDDYTNLAGAMISRMRQRWETGR